jgi:hypothetical protein
MKDAKDTIKDIKEMINDARSTQSDQPVPRTGVHALVKRRMKISFPLFFLLFSPVAIVLFYFGDTLGGWILLVTYTIGLIFLGWFFNRWSTSFNALEDLVDLERYLRNAIKQELDRNPIPGHDELRLATNQLREHIMEAYYDTLGIHLQTELFTYNGVPPNVGEPVPLFWKSAGGIPSNHATTQNHQATSSSISGNTQSQQCQLAVPQTNMARSSVPNWNTAPVVVTGTPVHQPTSGSSVTTTKSSNTLYQGNAAIVDPGAEMEC